MVNLWDYSAIYQCSASELLTLMTFFDKCEHCYTTQKIELTCSYAITNSLVSKVSSC